MPDLSITSQITFLYFDDMPAARDFFTHTLGLEAVYDTGWSCIWRTGRDSFVGAVATREGSIAVEARGGVLVSLNVRDIDAAYAAVKAHNPADLTDVKRVKDIALNSFFFTGPEGYKFEIQQFTDPKLSAIF